MEKANPNTVFNLVARGVLAYNQGRKHQRQEIGNLNRRERREQERKRAEPPPAREPERHREPTEEEWHKNYRAAVRNINHVWSDYKKPVPGDFYGRTDPDNKWTPTRFNHGEYGSDFRWYPIEYLHGYFDERGVWKGLATSKGVIQPNGHLKPLNSSQQ